MKCGDWDALATQVLRRKKLKDTLYRVGTILLYLAAAFVAAMSVYAVTAQASGDSTTKWSRTISHPFLMKPDASRADPTAPMNWECGGTTISVWRSSPIAWTSPVISEVPPTMMTGSRMSTSWSCCS